MSIWVIITGLFCILYGLIGASLTVDAVMGMYRAHDTRDDTFLYLALIIYVVIVLIGVDMLL